jgi:hypothetical protein
VEAPEASISPIYGRSGITALHRYQIERQPIVKKLVTAARTSADWYEKFPEHMRLDLMDFAYSYITRSGRIDDARLRAMSPVFMARYEASQRRRP